MVDNQVATKIDNTKFSISAQAIAALRYHEGVVPTYYNDPANCTYGVGTLVHLGPCTSEELHTEMTDEMIKKSLEDALKWAQRTVRQRVTNVQLTQEQFDGLVSFVYNRGPIRSRAVLKLIDANDYVGAVKEMKRSVYLKIKDKKTGKSIMKLMPGLVTRRAAESRSFVEAAKK